MSHTSAIVVAAGKGLRLKSRIAKPLVEIGSCPMVIYSLKALSNHAEIKDIIVVARPKNIKAIIRKIRRYGINKVRKVLKGGKRRQDSVGNGLKALDKNTDLVLIHDAARPFLDKKIISATIKEARRHNAAVAAVAVKATIKEIQNPKSKIQNKDIFVKKTLDRSKLWEIQTPQVFKKDLLLKAYKKFGRMAATDDAMLVEKLGTKVKIVPGSYANIKITTPEDLLIAKAILKKRTG